MYYLEEDKKRERIASQGHQRLLRYHTLKERAKYLLKKILLKCDLKSKVHCLEQKNSPILVTGSHASGTTWVGRMLELSGDCRYIQEPLSKLCNPKACACGLCVRQWFTYLDSKQERSAAGKHFHHLLAAHPLHVHNLVREFKKQGI